MLLGQFSAEREKSPGSIGFFRGNGKNFFLPARDERSKSHEKTVVFIKILKILFTRERTCGKM